MPPRGFFDGASLGRDCVLLRLSFFPGATMDAPWQMQNLWPLRTYLSLVRLCVWIHLYDLSIRSFVVVGIADPGPRTRTTCTDDARYSSIRFLVETKCRID